MMCSEEKLRAALFDVPAALAGDAEATARYVAETRALMNARTLNFSHDAMHKLVEQLEALGRQSGAGVSRDEALEQIDLLAHSFQVRFGAYTMAQLQLDECAADALALMLGRTISEQWQLGEPRKRSVCHVRASP